MILRVNPNRMELLKLRKRLALARRGHKLLQDKLEEMMRRFLALLKDIDRAKKDLQAHNQSVLGGLLYCRITSSKEDFEKSLSGVSSRVKIAVSTDRIMNVRVPVFTVEEVKIERHYSLFKTSAQMDLVIHRAKDYIQSLLKLAQSVKTLGILSYEIERTRRRVNALEYTLIPSIEETIRHITQKLYELERSNLMRLMRVKELIEAR